MREQRDLDIGKAAVCTAERYLNHTEVIRRYLEEVHDVYLVCKGLGGNYADQSDTYECAHLWLSKVDEKIRKYHLEVERQTGVVLKNLVRIAGSFTNVVNRPGDNEVLEDHVRLLKALSVNFGDPEKIGKRLTQFSENSELLGNVSRFLDATKTSKFAADVAEKLFSKLVVQLEFESRPRPASESSFSEFGYQQKVLRLLDGAASRLIWACLRTERERNGKKRSAAVAARCDTVEWKDGVIERLAAKSHPFTPWLSSRDGTDFRWDREGRCCSPADSPPPGSSPASSIWGEGEESKGGEEEGEEEGEEQEEREEGEEEEEQDVEKRGGARRQVDEGGEEREGEEEDDEGGDVGVQRMGGGGGLGRSKHEGCSERKKIRQ